ncbi:hydroxymethylglutaryl-CoA lyase [Acinetobacter haemolyticus]|uniref:hydroxymethylglutaryl-CoA lyase n=1 Tax=Acinetobacter haemolyticus TaxID=29430 RepID=A0A1L6KMP9_ACIHA|nr:hydroxymethylglutaryl-CoA lyase [Acinetobacter haemolyticus]APR70323.1 hydroxymethylglutaryl-CoA lyase [Acinetobacter haemolyticus]NAR19441.1 hydroxymethylglutaryl-CoA lyase [Acinetobacter haemolyticus]NAR29946.1 hydroxymethylglutaryl-CoA lyase [Acinetobacter haemolyticus]NAR34743.1 hydroxymethylglutaryl-CoA lyase [Acinetobacter haemolyticus]NAR48295.1 hydroxymethylglutaryl-CoA lyase [Acinetobacter haemolyticus]
MSDYVKIVEVGPRDGLQNEKQALSIEQRLSFINDLIDAGLKSIEVGSCVSAKWVPQMAQSDELFKLLPQRDELNLSLLTPNLKGFEAALAVGCKEVAVFTAASESFTRKNINCSIDESLERFSEIFQAAQANNVRVRGYVSCMVDCPYEGAIDPKQVVNVVKRLHDMGCYEISLGETIGTATPDRVQKVWQACLAELDSKILAGHFHNTYGMAIANIYQSLQQGIRVFDSSLAGLGGCPYAKGSSGNVATEDLYYLLSHIGYETGIHLEKLMLASQNINKTLNRKNLSNYANTYLQQHCA